ncbi:MAG: LPS-assembly protein LptD [Candidatus Aminicenantes bacterium]|nr:LPS-assembly protein LptD [Candidatus Aminicenantes bacterium]
MTPSPKAVGLLVLALVSSAVLLVFSPLRADGTETRAPAPAPPQASAGSGQDTPEWKVIAQFQEQTEDRVFAKGEVEIHYGDFILFADWVEIFLKTKDVRAEGNVVLQSPTEVLKGETLVFNADSGRGVMDGALGMAQPSLFFEAGRLERLDKTLYNLENARFTSCAQSVPRWQFSSSRATVKKEDYVILWNSVFQVKGVPVFYLPYISYPLERRTGFLIPHVGYTEFKGFELNQDFYWAMARNMDAVFKLSYYSRKGFGLGTDYRYIFSDGTAGNFTFRSFFFRADEADEKPKPLEILSRVVYEKYLSASCCSIFRPPSSSRRRRIVRPG